MIAINLFLLFFFLLFPFFFSIIAIRKIGRVSYESRILINISIVRERGFFRSFAFLENNISTHFGFAMTDGIEIVQSTSFIVRNFIPEMEVTSFSLFPIVSRYRRFANWYPRIIKLIFLLYLPFFLFFGSAAIRGIDHLIITLNSIVLQVGFSDDNKLFQRFSLLSNLFSQDKLGISDFQVGHRS